MTIREAARHFGTGAAGLYRRYAEWLVAISWRRFIVLSLLLLIMAAVLGEIPPFSWPIAQTSTPGRVRLSAGDNEIRIDEQGVSITRKRASEATREAAPKPQSLREEIAREIRDELAHELGSEREVVTKVEAVRIGDYFPQLAFLFIVFSAAIKIGYAGRVKAEAQAAQAREIADAESLKRQVLEARMAAMQAQVEPHFLFNTLASIDHLIEVDPPRASRMQKHLIGLLRASMPAMRETSANLGRELEVVRPYVEILKMRMGERLRAEINVPEGLYSADFPPMMLQSLVENAIKHGLEPKAEGGALSVGAEVVHGKLAVTVADTGVGFARAPTAGTRTGLDNIRERLKLLYGDAAELRITDNGRTGTRASIVVPYRTA